VAQTQRLSTEADDVRLSREAPLRRNECAYKPLAFGILDRRQQDRYTLCTVAWPVEQKPDSNRIDFVRSQLAGDLSSPNLNAIQPHQLTLTRYGEYLRLSARRLEGGGQAHCAPLAVEKRPAF